MRNHWIDEIRLRAAAEFLQELLTDEFENTRPDENAWVLKLLELMDNIYAGDTAVRSGLMRFTLTVTVGADGLVEQVALVDPL